MANSMALRELQRPKSPSRAGELELQYGQQDLSRHHAGRQTPPLARPGVQQVLLRWGNRADRSDTGPPVLPGDAPYLGLRPRSLLASAAPSASAAIARSANSGCP